MTLMATISHNDLAPAEAVHYSLAGAEFDLEGSDTFETDDHEVIRNAVAHPWLQIEYAEVAPGDEPVQPVVVEFPQTAVQAGLPQTEQHFTGEDADVPVAETIAADDAQGDELIEVEDPNAPDGDKE
jgi:hypothetical protein